MMKVLKDVFQLVLNIPTNSFAENVKVNFKGVTMTSVDGDEIVITGRKTDIVIEQGGNGNVRAIVYIVNDGTAIEERIDAMLEEEYELTPMAEISTISNGTVLNCTVDLRRSCQTQREMPVDMAPGVQETVEFLTSTAVEFDDQFVGDLVSALNSGKYPQIIDFITNLANL